jgi:hypothetical protein
VDPCFGLYARRGGASAGPQRGGARWPTRQRCGARAAARIRRGGAPARAGRRSGDSGRLCVRARSGLLGPNLGCAGQGGCWSSPSRLAFLWGDVVVLRRWACPPRACPRSSLQWSGILVCVSAVLLAAVVVDHETTTAKTRCYHYLDCVLPMAGYFGVWYLRRKFCTTCVGTGDDGAFGRHFPPWRRRREDPASHPPSGCYLR